MPSLLEKIYSLLPNKPQPTSTPTPEQIASYEAEAEETRKNLPWYKYYPTEIVEGITSGLLGLDDWTENQDRSVGDYANLLTQAGLPYAAIRGSQPVYRGARKYFETLDPSKYDVNDTLGWMTHFAERPTWANSFSGLDPHISKEVGVGGKLKASEVNPNISAAILPSKNVLDLINPNPEDLSAAIGAVPRPSKDVILRAYRNAVTNKATYPEDVFFKSPHRDIVGKLLHELNDPKIFRKTPFDAIRYNDVGDPSWAIPEEVLDEVTTPWGTKLNAGPIRRVYGEPETTNKPIQLGPGRHRHAEKSIQRWKQKPPSRIHDTFVIYDIEGHTVIKVTDEVNKIAKLTREPGLIEMPIKEWVDKMGISGLPEGWQRYYSLNQDKFPSTWDYKIAERFRQEEAPWVDKYTKPIEEPESRLVNEYRNLENRIRTGTK